MIYVIGALGIGGLILGLLLLYYRQRALAAEREAELQKARAENLLHVLELEKKLREAAAVDRDKIEAEIRETMKRVNDAKPGDVIANPFGAPTQPPVGGTT